MIQFCRYISIWIFTSILFAVSLSYGQGKSIKKFEYNYYKDSKSIDSVGLKKFPFVHQEDNYFILRNKIGRQYILNDYETFEGDKNIIILEKILYLFRDNDNILLIGNLMGSRYSIVLNLKERKKRLELLYSEELGYVTNVTKETVLNTDFIAVTTHYSDVCELQEYYVLYCTQIPPKKIFKAFSGYKKREFFNGDPICKGDTSYTQSYTLSAEQSEIILKTIREDKGTKLKSINKYTLRKNKFR
jgi:hypothetical protein